MKVFITGATGFIGIHLAKTLAASGHTVHALYRSEKKLAPLADITNIILFKGDITEPESLEKAMNGCEQVYHVAAFADVWAKDPSIIYKLNVEATKNIFKIAQKLEIQKIVFTSTAGVYGPSLKGEVTEMTSRSLDFFVEYERTKFIAEEKAREYVNKGLDIVIVNPTRVYGPGLLSKSNSVTLMIKQFSEGKWRIIPGNGKSIGNYVFVEDVVKGHLLAMEKGKSGENYILGGSNASYIEFFDILRDLTGRKHKLFKLPLFIMLCSAHTMMLITKIFGKPPLITPALVRKFNYQWDVSSKKAETELGYTITTLKEGMQSVLEWVKTKKYN